MLACIANTLGLGDTMSNQESADSKPLVTTPEQQTPPAIDKVAAALDSIRLELQGIRSALEALVAKP